MVISNPNQGTILADYPFDIFKVVLHLNLFVLATTSSALVTTTTMVAGS